MPYHRNDERSFDHMVKHPIETVVCVLLCVSAAAIMVWLIFGHA